MVFSRVLDVVQDRAECAFLRPVLHVLLTGSGAPHRLLCVAACILPRTVPGQSGFSDKHSLTGLPIKRKGRHTGSPKGEITEIFMRALIRTGKLVVNVETQTVEVDGHPIPIAGKEYAILELLILHKGSVVTKELLAHHLYGEVDNRRLSTARVILYNLRKKLAHARDGQYYIETVGGRGYMLRDLVE